MKTFKAYIAELEEGSIKGSGTDRKAKLKKAYRAGEQKTRNFYQNDFSDTVNDKDLKDKGINHAYKSGKNAGDGSPTPTGSKRSKPQSRLRKHDTSKNPTPGSKNFRVTHSQKMYNIRSVAQRRGENRRSAQTA